MTAVLLFSSSFDILRPASNKNGLTSTKLQLHPYQTLTRSEDVELCGIQFVITWICWSCCHVAVNALATESYPRLSLFKLETVKNEIRMESMGPQAAKSDLTS